MNTKKTTERDYLKANRRASREAEIENHTHPISFSRVHKTKKVYDRKRQKADDKRHLPSFFYDRVSKQAEAGYNMTIILYCGQHSLATFYLPFSIGHTLLPTPITTRP